MPAHLIDVFFIPFLVLAAGALLLAARYGTRREKILVWGSATFFCGGVALHAVLASGSSRYFLLFHLPLLMLAGACCTFLERCRLLHFRHWGTAAIVLLLLLCTAKTFRPRNCRNPYREVMQIIQRDARQYSNPVFLTLAENDARCRYYAEIPTYMPPGASNGHQVSFEEIRAKNFEKIRYLGDAVYLVWKEGRGAGPFSGKQLFPEAEWTLLGTRPLNRSGSRKLHCYRFVPERPACPVQSEQFLKNSDFSLVARGADHQNVIRRICHVAPDYFSAPNLMEPRDWILLPGIHNQEKHRVIRAELKPGEGMLLHTDRAIVLTATTRVPIADSVVRCALTPHDDSGLILRVHKWAPGGTSSTEERAYLHLAASGPTTCEIPITGLQPDAGEQTFSISILLQYGHVVLQKVELYRLRETGHSEERKP